VIAKGKDPSGVKAGELGGEEVVTIGADDSVDEALTTMKDHKVRRLPVSTATTSSAWSASPTSPKTSKTLGFDHTLDHDGDYRGRAVSWS
jgi:CBS domain-containing protein